MVKLTNAHYSLLDLIKHLNTEVNHYCHLSTKYPEDPRCEQAIHTMNFFQTILNFATGREDTCLNEKGFEYIKGLVKDLNTSGKWKTKVQKVQEVQEVQKVQDIEEVAEFIAQTVVTDIIGDEGAQEEVKEVKEIQEVKPKKAKSKKTV